MKGEKNNCIHIIFTYQLNSEESPSSDLVIWFLIIFRSICCTVRGSIHFAFTYMCASRERKRCDTSENLLSLQYENIFTSIQSYLNFDRSQFICLREIECQIGCLAMINRRGWIFIARRGETERELEDSQNWSHTFFIASLIRIHTHKLTLLLAIFQPQMPQIWWMREWFVDKSENLLSMQFACESIRFVVFELSERREK